MIRSFISLTIIILFLSRCTTPIQTPNELFGHKEIISHEKIAPDSTHFKDAWLIFFEQPIDHNNLELGTFKQRIWLSHLDKEAPVICVTEGYSAKRNYTSELAQLLKANQIIIEHRYFAESRPDSLNWQYLTVEQAAADHHRIIQFFKKFYSKKWLTTGIRKGGQTAIFHRAFYLDDVDLSVPYVAPINLSREDHRLFDFFMNVGTPEERAKIESFQQNVLMKRDEIMPLFKTYAKDKNYTFRMGYDKAFDLVVLEYTFSFWQWGSNIEDIPTNDATANELFNHLKEGSDVGYVSDQSWNDIKPFFFQAYKELGYYAYVPGKLSPLLKGYHSDTISSSMFAPGGDTLTFQPTMQLVMQQLQQFNPEIIAIIGQNDPWGSTSIINSKLTNTMRAVAPEGSHLTRIRTLPLETQNTVIEKINEIMYE
ncbi:S28 family serine protease [Carboxylicivirga marina]|uniref:Peptidase n=1 Tax=Carboxylicivirga marina TaxID=2800988 RepID=A0ABS1HJB7_9BACT|nr:S28 family serine protease [Carboxylicivirga marina]MBK3517773.1 peptidase [Carboxylicivirga marina]